MDHETSCPKESSHPLVAGIREIVKDIRNNCIQFLVCKSSSSLEEILRTMFLFNGKPSKAPPVPKYLGMGYVIYGTQNANNNDNFAFWGSSRANVPYKLIEDITQPTESHKIIFVLEGRTLKAEYRTSKSHK